MDFAGCADDSSFGPSVHGCRGGFDFTLRFEQIFFSILPSSLLIVLGLLRVWSLLRRSCVVDGVWFQLTKAGCFFAICALRLALLALAAHSGSLSRTFVAAAALDAIAALCMVVLSFFEHSRCPRPSILLNLYLVVKTLLDIAQTRTLWVASRSSHDFVFARLFAAATALWAIAIILEATRKRRWAQWNAAEHSPEETIGIYEIATNTWVFRLIRTGRRKVLSAPDLYTLDYGMSAEALHSHVKNLNISQLHGKKNALAKALFKTLLVPVLLAVVPILCQVGLALCQPLLVQRLLIYLDNKGSRSDYTGYGLIGATVIVYFGAPLAYSVALSYQTRYLFMMRSILIDVVYRKTTSSQCSISNDSKALTLMGTDVENIRHGLLSLHQLWYVPLQVAVSCWLLYGQLGAAFAAPIVLITCLTIANFVVMHWVQPFENRWMERLELRVGKTSNVIANMKNLKISGLAQSVERSIQGMRVDEMKAVQRFRILELLVMATGFAPGALSAMFTFAVTSKNLDVTTIFTSIALLELLASPLNNFFQGIPGIIAAFVCIQRVQNFLETEDRMDFRQIRSAVDADAPNPTQPASTGPTIRISDGTFGWEPEKMILKGIDASFFCGLNIVVGPVASGKSTLCNVLLGETPFVKGTIEFFINPGKTAFCDQVPALFNATLKENVAGFGDVDAQRYARAIQATMLGPDLETLPDGDETKIGSNGITLSGGQKQRVSIARAIYEECDFYIFDDVLSGLDNDTARHVFSHVFGSSGVLRERNATVILCTHAVHYLSEATHIIALGLDGTLVEEGSFEHLNQNERYIQSLKIDKSRDETTDSEKLTAATGDAEPESDFQAVVKPVKDKPAEASAKKNLRASGDWQVFLHYFRSIGKVWVTLFMLTGVACGFGWSFPNAWLALWSNDASTPPQRHSTSFYIGIYSLLSCLRLGFTMSQLGLGMMILAKISGLNLHKDALRTVIAAPLRFFVKTDVGVVTNLFSQDMSLIDNELPGALIDTFAMLWMVIGSAAVAATSSAYVLISYPFLIMAAYFIQRFYLMTSRQLRLLDLEAKSPLYLATFRAFRWTDASIIKNNALLNTSTNPGYQLAIIQRWLVISLRLLVAVIAIIVVTLATQLKASTGFAGASMVSLVTFSGYLSSLLNAYTNLETSLGAVNRLRSFGTSTEKEDLPGEDTVPPVSWPQKGRIEIGGASASYDYSPLSPANVSEKEDSGIICALRDIDLTIESGQKVAICGRTGSGKSSFILMLLRLLDPLPRSNLKLAIDGLSLTEIDRGTLRQRIIAVPQEPVFLPNGTSFMLNLDPGQVATEEECKAALEAVELWNVVCDRGGLEAGLSADFFSLGQKQLFSLARAILRRRVRLRQHETDSEKPTLQTEATGAALKPTSAAHTSTVQVEKDGGVLVLDEYGSSLDIATDRLMQQIILREFSGYTIVMVSHRLEMVMEFDKVVVLDTGRIVEDGAPDELVEKNGSRFRDLWMARNAR
ncbi:ABC transporter [Akanthomyces lecanii RCEF 1005]|uniref:ABC transporter n=1 Tax=Akanthomyces lecanii RCEF 1005 TaxID=1081108 RepID=A0A162LKS5_CORDF|nr:ABC transporter [Akanthomyces lecanii RCEF 1005]